MTYDGRRDGESYSSPYIDWRGTQGFKVGKDQFGKNMITGAPDGYAPNKILEVYEIN